MVPKKFTANTTQTTAIATSIGQISSAYSLRLGQAQRQRDRGGDDDRCQPQKWMRDRASLHIRILSRRCSE